MQEIKIINCITIEGKTRLWNELTEPEKKEMAELLQERLMNNAGYKRRTA